MITLINVDLKNDEYMYDKIDFDPTARGLALLFPIANHAFWLEEYFNSNM